MAYPHKWSPISYTGRAQDSESSPMKERRSTAEPHNQVYWGDDRTGVY